MRRRRAEYRGHDYSSIRTGSPRGSSGVNSAHANSDIEAELRGDMGRISPHVKRKIPLRPSAPSVRLLRTSSRSAWSSKSREQRRRQRPDSTDFGNVPNWPSNSRTTANTSCGRYRRQGGVCRGQAPRPAQAGARRQLRGHNKRGCRASSGSSPSPAEKAEWKINHVGQPRVRTEASGRGGWPSTATFTVRPSC